MTVARILLLLCENGRVRSPDRIARIAAQRPQDDALRVEKEEIAAHARQFRDQGALVALALVAADGG